MSKVKVYVTIVDHYRYDASTTHTVVETDDPETFFPAEIDGEKIKLRKLCVVVSENTSFTDMYAVDDRNTLIGDPLYLVSQDELSNAHRAKIGDNKDPLKALAMVFNSYSLMFSETIQELRASEDPLEEDDYSDYQHD